MEQHMHALRRATKIRVYRAELKRQIKAGEVRVCTLLEEPTLPEFASGMPVVQVITAIRRVSPRVAATVLAKLRIPELKPLGQLTPRQRRILAEEIAKRERVAEVAVL